MSDKKEEGAKRKHRTPEQWFADGIGEIQTAYNKMEDKAAADREYAKAERIKKQGADLLAKITEAQKLLFSMEGATNEN